MKNSWKQSVRNSENPEFQKIQKFTNIEIQMIRKRKSRGKNHGKSKNSQNPEIQIIQKFGN